MACTIAFKGTGLKKMLVFNERFTAKTIAQRSLVSAICTLADCISRDLDACLCVLGWVFIYVNMHF